MNVYLLLSAAVLVLASSAVEADKIDCQIVIDLTKFWYKTRKAAARAGLYNNSALPVESRFLVDTATV